MNTSSTKKCTRPAGAAAAAALAVAALAAMLGLAGCSGADAAGDTYVTANAEHTITASASAEVKVVPDKARINLGVVSNEDTAAAAQAANAESVDAVLAALKAAGVDEKSIRTEYVNLYQAYDYMNDMPKGYEMTTTLAVEGMDIDAVGTVVQAAVDAGATRVDGISYYASGYDAAYDEALAQAIAVSRTKAETMAAAADVQVGVLVGLVEGYQDTSARYVYGNYDMVETEEAAADAGAGAASMQAMPGELTVRASVTATYAI